MGYTGDKKREYDRAFVQKRKSEYFSNKSCSKCGSTIDLELDHIDRTTKTSHSIWSWSQQRRDAELVKCQVLCSDCHKTKTAEECKALFTIEASKWKHGTNNTYNKRGCRCELCRKWRADKFQRLRT